MPHVDAAAHRQVREKRPRDRRLGGPLFGPQCFGKIERHLWVRGVPASTSARSSLGWTTFFAAFVPGSSSTTTRSLVKIILLRSAFDLRFHRGAKDVLKKY